MKTFSKFITEARMTTVGEITAAIARYKKADEILNPEYQDLGIQARRIFGGDTNAARNVMLKHMHAEYRPQELTDLYYSWPNDSFASLNKSAKILAKIKDPKLKDVVAASNQVVKTWTPIAADLKDLKGKVVKVTQKRAEAKQAAANVMSAKKADSSSLMKIFESHKKEYLEVARTRAASFIKDKLDTMKQQGWDIDKVAPPPNSRTMGVSEYKAAQAKRDLYRSLTKSTKTMLSRGEPDIRHPNQAMIDRYIELNVRGAEDAYNDFMEKMIRKIGKPVIDAVMTGNIWTNATLKVTTNDGENQVWNTKMILNFSKYQKMFNQFPSRRMS